MLPVHTPYADSSKPFEIGLRPLDLKDWIEVDEHLPRYLKEKRRLMNEVPERVFVAEAGSAEAQREVLDMLVPHLLMQAPDLWRERDNRILVAGTVVDLDDEIMPDLQKAAFLVQEDLVLMRKGAVGWWLVAGSVCFPSSWSLLEKFRKPMHEIHAPVPGFGTGTRNAMVIERIFDNLLIEQPVERFNWSVYNDDLLYHDDRWGEHFPDNQAVMQDDFFLRIEHQTLRKLTKSGDILFTIRIHIDPIDCLSRRSDRGELIPGFVKSIRALSEKEMQYKGFNDGCELLVQRLEGLLEGS